MCRTLLFLLLLTATLASSSWSQSASSAGTGEVTLQPGDIIRVFIWREEDLSGDFPVNERGTAVFPLLGEWSVTEMPMTVLRDSIMAAYRVQLRNPSITITPLRRINVLGEVQQPGLYPVDPTISLSGAIALAGGTSPDGDLSRIRVLRGGQVVHDRINAAAILNTVDIRSGDQIIVERRAWLDRNSAALVTTGVSLLGSIITTLIFITATQ